MAEPGRRLSVVLASRLFAPEPAAASLRLAALVRALSDAGHDVRVLTTTVPGDDEYACPSRVSVHRWPVLRDAAGYVRGYVQYLSFDVPLALRLLLARRPDVVVVEPPPTTGLVVAVVAALRRVPFVYYAADVWSDAVRSAGVAVPVQRVLRFVERRVMRAASAILATSDGVAERLVALGVGSGVVTVGNGIDVETFSPDGPAESVGGPYLVYTGTASEVHGADVFTRAMGAVLAQRPDARLVFIGQGSDVELMRSQASAYPDGAVTFLPRMSAERTACWIRGARAALASVRPGDYGFAFPSKVYAAAACGTPVVFAGVGPARDLVAAGDLGAVVDHDVDAAATAMLAALDSETTTDDRRRRAGWARANVSIDAAARRAVTVVADAGVTAGRGRRARRP